ncbi:oligosaccharide repeat unit polymerase [Polynucleobacter paneuropaeus]|nr:oligosaccharide repeat unit polymerase [Polynucleobacter paneuropaeus]MBT8532382.1 oligosaccharide repeat unit polymerase [Polynucleobacter paneuropaeus]MBT8602596.1 oligosaccharide repeat unit polymerase [Polynucleobacter paneuropaeus]MBT8624788.1 oligosaccharide repeat unit polymerase [Polynucleobacter paneuropaeus]MBT8630101.1 oligosaccharide repeat unit polymerase [Polynucleobacter paneuropaeus]
MIQFKFFSILLSFAILSNFFIIKRITGSTLHPSGLFSLFWFFCILIPELILWDYETNLFSILYIYLSSLMILIPVVIIKKRIIKKLYYQYCTERLKLLFILFALISILTTIQMLLQNGFYIIEFFSNPFKGSGQFANLRASDDFNYGFIGIINISSTYISAALGGIIAQTIVNEWQKKIFYIFALMPALLLMALQSQKLVLLIGLGYFLGGLFLSKLLRGEQLKFKSLLEPIKILVIIAPLLILSFLSRSHYDGLQSSNSEMYDLLYRDIVNYLFSEIFAFSDFFTCYAGFDCTVQYDFVGFRPGQFTFYSIFSSLNLVEDSGSVLYSQIYQLGTITPAMQFTIFRWIIQDFGFIGGLFFFFCIGTLFSIIFESINRNNHNLISNVLYISVLPFILFSYVLTIFMAKFPLLVATLLFLSLRISTLKNERNI